MQYRFDPNLSEKPLSRLIYGTANAHVLSDDAAEAAECLDAALEAGFTVFDTARSYGNAEGNLGAWLAGRGVREKITLVDKGCNPGQGGSTDELTAGCIRQQITVSLQKLQTEYTDLYLLHRDDPAMPVEPIVEELNALKAEGKLRHFGVSNWSISRINEANAYAAAHGLEGLHASSPAYSLAEMVHDPWGRSVTLSGAGKAAERAAYTVSQLPVFAYSALGRGYLSGKFDPAADVPVEQCLPWAPIAEYDSPENRRRLTAAFALAGEAGLAVSTVCLCWLLAQPQNVYPIVSPGSATHMRQTAAALALPEDLVRRITAICQPE